MFMVSATSSTPKGSSRYWQLRLRWPPPEAGFEISSEGVTLLRTLIERIIRPQAVHDCRLNRRARKCTCQASQEPCQQRNPWCMSRR